MLVHWGQGSKEPTLDDSIIMLNLVVIGTSYTNLGSAQKTMHNITT